MFNHDSTPMQHLLQSHMRLKPQMTFIWLSWLSHIATDMKPGFIKLYHRSHFTSYVFWWHQSHKNLSWFSWEYSYALWYHQLRWHEWLQCVSCQWPTEQLQLSLIFLAKWGEIAPRHFGPHLPQWLGPRGSKPCSCPQKSWSTLTTEPLGSWTTPTICGTNVLLPARKFASVLCCKVRYLTNFSKSFLWQTPDQWMPQHGVLPMKGTTTLWLSRARAFKVPDSLYAGLHPWQQEGKTLSPVHWSNQGLSQC